MPNEGLGAARAAKNDEFYTQFSDIEKEMNAYLEFDDQVFAGKTILLPCDDPEWSNFTKYFAQNFEKLQLKKLVSTSYAPDSRPINMLSQPSLFESESPKFDPSKTRSRGKIFTLERDRTGDNRIDVHDLDWDYLDGDGDFRSDELLHLRAEADVIITNPPFSLFREFLAWVVEADTEFVVIANMNAITYKEVFPLIRDGKLWIGATNFNTGMYFFVPDSFEYAPTYKFARELDGKKVSRVPGVCWFTNLDHGRRHEPLVLMTEADNIKFSRHKAVKGVGYQPYDNYDAIEVPFTDAIPSDYPGVMGVPISFLSKYNPDQFDLIGMAKRGAGDPALKTKVYTADDYPNYSDLNAGPVLITPDGPINTYPRILIRHKGVAP